MKMSKIITSLSVIGALGMASQAGAVELTGGVSTTDCNILANSVTISLSKNVGAGYTCLAANAAASPPVIAQVGAGTCNTGGNAKAKNPTCTRTVTGTAPDFVYSNYTPAAGCGAGQFDAGASTGKTGAAGQTTVAINGITWFSATTAGGATGTDGLTSACSGANVSAAVEKLYGATTAK